MTLQEKLAQEDGQYVRLYKQGLFWTAYDQSALLLCSQRPLKIQRRWYKSVGREVLSVGFPDSSLAHFEQAWGPGDVVEARHRHWQVRAAWGVDQAGLHQYALSAAPVAPKKSAAPAAPASQPVLERLRSFQLAARTPMDAMQLVQELQEQLRLADV